MDGRASIRYVVHELRVILIKYVVRTVRSGERSPLPGLAPHLARRQMTAQSARCQVASGMIACGGFSSNLGENGINSSVSPPPPLDRRVSPAHDDPRTNGALGRAIKALIANSPPVIEWRARRRRGGASPCPGVGPRSLFARGRCCPRSTHKRGTSSFLDVLCRAEKEHQNWLNSDYLAMRELF